MYKNHSGQYTQNIDKSRVEEKPVMPGSVRMKPNRPTGRRKVIRGAIKPTGIWVALPR